MDQLFSEKPRKSGKSGKPEKRAKPVTPRKPQPSRRPKASGVGCAPVGHGKTKEFVQNLENAKTPLQYVDVLRNGVPWDYAAHIIQCLGLSDMTLASILKVPNRTLQRRKGGVFEASEGERVLRLGRLLGMAVEVLGSTEKAGSWLFSPNGALGNATPVSLVDTDVGTQAVEAVLGRIAYGIFS